MQFHCKFRLTFSLILSENAPNVDFRDFKLNVKISRGSMPLDPSCVTAPLVLNPILLGSTLLCFTGPGIVCNLPFEKQLFGYIHYCTEISKININLLPNTCNFHRNFRLIFSLHFSENAQNVHFREAKFQNFAGEHAPGPP